MNARALRILGLGILTWLVTLALPAPPVEAGIVIYNNGNYIIGRIREEEVERDDDGNLVRLTVRWPYGRNLNHGQQVVPGHEVRWFSVKYDRPTNEYWEEFHDKIIDPHWRSARDRFLRQKRLAEKMDGTIHIRITPPDRLEVLPIDRDFFIVYKPEKWTTKEKTISFESYRIPLLALRSHEPRHGYAPRIHIFWTYHPQESPTEQVNWVRETLARFGHGMELEEEPHLTPVGDRAWDCEFVSNSRTADGRVLKCLRRVMIRKNRVYFVFCYAHEDDWEVRLKTFKKVLEKFVIKDDAAAGE